MNNLDDAKQALEHCDFNNRVHAVVLDEALKLISDQQREELFAKLRDYDWLSRRARRVERVPFVVSLGDVGETRRSIAKGIVDGMMTT